MDKTVTMLISMLLYGSICLQLEDRPQTWMWGSDFGERVLSAVGTKAFQMDFASLSEPNGHLHVSTRHLFEMQRVHLSRIEQTAFTGDTYTGRNLYNNASLWDALILMCSRHPLWDNRPDCLACDPGFVPAAQLSVQRQKQQLHWGTMWMLILEDFGGSDLWSWCSC